jgi:hypothetical protein
MPFGVRKRSALPFRQSKMSGLRPEVAGRSRKSGVRLTGRPEAFRTPDGTADSPFALFRVDLSDLRALYSQTSHQALLSKKENIDAFLGGRSSQ